MKTLALILVLSLSSILAQAQKPEVNWMTWEEVLEAMKTDPRPVIVDVYTDWCGWCKRMDQSTYSDPAVVDYVNKSYYAIKFDAEQKEPITVGDSTYVFVPQGRRGYHQWAAVIMDGRMSYPTTVFYDDKLARLQPVGGYLDKKQFMTIVSYLGEGHYKTTPYEQYQASYSTIKSE